MQASLETVGSCICAVVCSVVMSIGLRREGFRSFELFHPGFPSSLARSCLTKERSIVVHWKDSGIRMRGRTHAQGRSDSSYVRVRPTRLHVSCHVVASGAQFDGCIDK